MASITSELIWIKSFLAAMGVVHASPMKLYCENEAAFHIAKNPTFHERTKHIEMDCHFVRERLISSDPTTGYVFSKNQVANIFTKALGKQQFHFLMGKLGIVNPYALPWGEVLGINIVIIYLVNLFVLDEETCISS